MLNQEMSTLAWIPKSDAAVYGDKQIIALYTCAYPPESVSAPGALGDSGARKTNHWVLYCALSPTSSVRVDASPAGPNMSLVVMLSAQSEVVANDAVRSVRLPTSGLTVNGLLDLIRAAGFDRYQFTASGQGCRYWICTLIKLLESRGALPDDEAVNKLVEDISSVWLSKDECAPASEQTGVQEGTFFDIGK